MTKLSDYQQKVLDRINVGDYVSQWDCYMASHPSFWGSRGNDRVRSDTLNKLADMGLIVKTRKNTDHGMNLYWHKNGTTVNNKGEVI